MDESDAESQHAGSVQPQPLLGDALARFLKRVLNRGQNELERVAVNAGSRLELRTMRKDLDHFWVRLGKTAYHLVQAGEVDHPGLRKAMARIDELEARIDAMRAERNLDPPEPKPSDG